MELEGRVCFPNIFFPSVVLAAFMGWTLALLFLKTCVGSHGLLQQGDPVYDAKRQELYDHYHPLEFSPHIGLEEKTNLMEEWYVTQFFIGEGFMH